MRKWEFFKNVVEKVREFWKLRNSWKCLTKCQNKSRSVETVETVETAETVETEETEKVCVTDSLKVRVEWFLAHAEGF